MTYVWVYWLLDSTILFGGENGRQFQYTPKRIKEKYVCVFTKALSTERAAV